MLFFFVFKTNAKNEIYMNKNDIKVIKQVNKFYTFIVNVFVHM